MKRMHHIIITAAALLLCSMALHAKDEDKNRFHIDNHLYQIYERAYKLMHDVDPRYTALSDSLFHLAGSMGETKAQCLALDLDCTYAMLLKPTDEDFIHKYIDRARQFAEKTPYQQYVFGGWGRHIINLIENTDMRCMDEISEFQKEAFRLKNGYGMSRSYEFYSAIYKSLKLYHSAVTANALAIDYQMRYGNPNELYRFYFNMGNLYYVLHEYSNALKYINMSLASNYITTNIKLKCYDLKAKIYHDEKNYGKFLENYKLYASTIDENKKIVIKDKIDYLNNLKSLYYTSIENDTAKALEACRHIISGRIRLTAQQHVYEHAHNYKAAYYARKALSMINKHSTEERIHRIINIQKLIRRNEIEMQRSEIEQSNQKLLQQQAALAAIQANELLAIEQKKQQKSQLDTRAELSRIESNRLYRERQKAQHQTRMIKERERMARLNAIEAKHEQQRLMISGVLIISFIAAAVSCLSAYYQNLHARTLRRLSLEAMASAEHKDMLIDQIQQAINPTAREMSKQVEQLSNLFSLQQSVDKSKSIAIQGLSDSITSTVDQLIEKVINKKSPY